MTPGQLIGAIRNELRSANRTGAKHQELTLFDAEATRDTGTAPDAAGQEIDHGNAHTPSAAGGGNRLLLPQPQTPSNPSD